MDHPPSIMHSVALIVALAGSAVSAQETQPVEKTKGDQQRNAELLSGFDYSKYPSALTGYTGQDRQQIVFERREHAIRVPVGPRGNYKAELAELPDGKLVLATCRNNNDAYPTKKRFLICVYQSADQGLTWETINKTPLFDKEPSLTALPDGTLVMSAQKGCFGPGSQAKEAINMACSKDGGRTWELDDLPGADYPRNMIVEKDGSLLFVRTVKSDWSGDGSPNLQLCRSKDGKTWQFSEGAVDWSYAAFGEVSAVRLKDGRLLAALRWQIPKTEGEGFEDTVITEDSAVARSSSSGIDDHKK